MLFGSGPLPSRPVNGRQLVPGADPILLVSAEVLSPGPSAATGLRLVALQVGVAGSWP